MKGRAWGCGSETGARLAIWGAQNIYRAGIDVNDFQRSRVTLIAIDGCVDDVRPDDVVRVDRDLDELMHLQVVIGRVKGQVGLRLRGRRIVKRFGGRETYTGYGVAVNDFGVERNGQCEIRRRRWLVPAQGSSAMRTWVCCQRLIEPCRVRQTPNPFRV